MTDFSVPRITCSEEDADWVLKLPPLLDLTEEEDDVEVTVLSTSFTNLFQFRAKERTVFMDPTTRILIIKGSRCPYPAVQITFKLQSKTLGVNIQSIGIPVVRNQRTSTNDKTALPKLEVAKSKILANGRLTLTFNSEVRWPALRTDSATEPKSSLRVLEED